MKKILVERDFATEGLALREVEPITADGDIALLYNSDEGFTVVDVEGIIESSFMCPLCGSSIKSTVEFKSQQIPKQWFAILSSGIPCYGRERMSGYMYYRWRCLGCSAATKDDLSLLRKGES